MGGSPGRMESFAEVIAKEIKHPVNSKEELCISRTDRFAFYKIGPVLSISVSWTGSMENAMYMYKYYTLYMYIHVYIFVGYH